VAPLDLSIQGQFWALASLVKGWPGVDEVVPGMNNLMVVLRRGECDHQVVLDDIRKEWLHLSPMTLEGKLVDIPVVYGGEKGRDLEMVAQRADLALADAAALHAAPIYRVYFLGAHAGFGYLGGLDPRLHAPRLEQPRVSVPAGSVAIGGVQTGVIAQTSPSGWRLIGSTDLTFFDAAAEPPALFAPGDRVRFHVSRVEA
jgi:KipI family sensor histidine kinase inhibitor